MRKKQTTQEELPPEQVRPLSDFQVFINGGHMRAARLVRGEDDLIEVHNEVPPFSHMDHKMLFTTECLQQILTWARVNLPQPRRARLR